MCAYDQTLVVLVSLYVSSFSLYLYIGFYRVWSMVQASITKGA